MTQPGFMACTWYKSDPCMVCGGGPSHCLFLGNQHISDADLLQISKHGLGLSWIETCALHQSDPISELSRSASIQMQS